MTETQKRWSNPAVWSFIVGLFGWWCNFSMLMEYINGTKSGPLVSISLMQLIGYLLAWLLTLLLGTRAIREIKKNQELSGRFFAISGIFLGTSAIIFGLLALIIFKIKII